MKFHMRNALFAQHAARWKELGFQGEPPRIENFESFEGQVHI